MFYFKMAAILARVQHTESNTHLLLLKLIKGHTLIIKLHKVIALGQIIGLVMVNIM